MSYRKQRGSMWGCRVVWHNQDKEDEPKWHEEWMWDTLINADGTMSFPLVFTETQKEIMPLVRYMRKQGYVKSATSARVRIPNLS